MSLNNEVRKIFDEINACILSGDFEKITIEKYTILIKVKDYQADIWIASGACCLYSLQYRDLTIKFPRTGWEFKNPKTCLKQITALSKKEKEELKRETEREMEELKKKLEKLNGIK